MIRSNLLPAGLMTAAVVVAWPGAAAPTVKADIQYATAATGEPLRLDLFTPESGAGAPLIVWVHGGAWENGNKSAMPLAPVIERGFAVASLDFSPASKARFPGQVHEIKAAIRFLRAQAKQYGYDASRVAIAGASSGAHLAAVVGTRRGLSSGTAEQSRDGRKDRLARTTRESKLRALRVVQGNGADHAAL